LLKHRIHLHKPQRLIIIKPSVPIIITRLSIFLVVGRFVSRAHGFKLAEDFAIRIVVISRDRARRGAARGSTYDSSGIGEVIFDRIVQDIVADLCDARRIMLPGLG
jgi:hypothetical protein